MTTDEILDLLEERFPNAECELYHQNAFQLIVAVVLSAQTTDQSVNRVTPALFERYPDAGTMAMADVKAVEGYIKTIGLYHNKSRMIIGLAQSLMEHFQGEVPSSMKDLTSLSGVGRKTANVVRSVWFDIPALAVDTHVERISKRLGLAKVQDSVETVETKLKRKIKRERWNRAHHLFIFFGRYMCTARNPQCEGCPFVSFCKKDKLEAYRKTKG
ncbi:endonuclease III [Clostridiaceae bacterium DONG20-135]|uniref:Endonuclease III n=1 Tax=Copranaerobaculum intestinale TaxID=2692629 RepID=A0A6N8U991_9FIRM|nr:endonuclease III [Copranaerobaculum intestinale]MXQ73894.1 endonuclease III [Copranaerobaculum intestinale]